MRIEKIEYDEKKNWFVYQISNGEIFHLSYESYIKLALHKGHSISPEIHDFMEDEDQRNLARYRGENFALYQPRTAFEIDQKLVREGIRGEVRRDVLAWLEKRGLVDDARYAGRYAQEKARTKSWSKRKIFAMLRQKGVSPDLIKAALDGLDEDRERENIKSLLERKYGRRNLSDPKDFNRTYQALVRRGFPSGLVLQSMKAKLEMEGHDVE